MKIVNLTKWEVTLIRENGEAVILPSNGELKVKQENVSLSQIDGFPINQTTYSSEGENNLPPKEEGTIYLVSVVALQSLPISRDDFFTVDKAVKDGSGKIIGHKALARPSVYGS